MNSVLLSKKENIKLRKSLERLSNRGKTDQAIEICLSKISQGDINPVIHLFLGDLYLKKHLDIHQAKDFIDEAITQYQIALESDMETYELYYKLGCAFYHKGDLDKAINYFNITIDKKYNHSESYLMLARTYSKKSNFIEALEYAKKAIKYSKLKSASAHYLVYNLYKITGQNSFCRRLKQLFELCLYVITLPFDKEASLNLMRTISYLKFLPTIFRAIIEVQKNDYEKAIEIYRKAIEKAPRCVQLYCLLGLVYRMMGRFDDAICEYKMSIWLDSLNIGAYRELCQLYEEIGDYDNAILIYLKLIDIQPHIAEYQSNLGNLLYLKGDIKGALARYQNAITLNPNPLWTSVIAQTLGYVFQESGINKDAAILAYQAAYLLTPKDIDIYINLGSAFYEKSEYENALLVYRQALNLEPHNSKIHCNIAYLHWGIGNIDEAIKEYELAIKYDPTYDIAYNNLGVIYLDDLGRVHKAIEMFTEAITYNPNYALAHYNLARSIALSGDEIEAAKLFQVALDINSITHEIDPEEIVEKINALFK